ncbi:MAG TPA: hypothetical protein VFB50_16950, partial [Chloroflexota bacterium]|nr:hypothetical protein [Chloroflexota bacterium]
MSDGRMTQNLRLHQIMPLRGPVSVATVRDTLLAARVTAVQWEQCCSVPPEAVRQHAVHADEAREIAKAARDAMLHGRLFDFGLLPGEVLDETTARAGPLWTQEALAWPYRAPWLFTWVSDEIAGIPGAPSQTRYVVLVGMRTQHEVAITDLAPMLTESGLRFIIGDLAKFRMPEFGVQVQPTLARFLLDDPAQVEAM